MRKLTDTSWIAQAIQDKIDATDNKFALQALKILVNMADSETPGVRYEGTGSERSIIISDIPNVSTEYGTDFSKDGMASALLGLQARYTDSNGEPTAIALVTHDLNSASIKIHRLMDAIRGV